jgi:hypothetical protein
MASLGRAWHGVRQLSWTDRGLAGRAWVLLFLAATGLRMMGFRRTQAAVGSIEPDAHGRRDLTEAMVVARIVHAAANHHVLQPNCLVRSMVLVRMLRLRGLDAELRIGVATPHGRFAAHAWVEHAGVALAEPSPPSGSYGPFDEAWLTR